MQLPHTVGRAYDALGESAERHAKPLLLIFLAILFFGCLGNAAHLPSTYDELVVLGVASQPRVADVWSFFASGRDTVGPMSALVVRAARNLPFSIEISTRLPSIAFYLVMTVCGYCFLRRRYPAAYALSSVLMLAAYPILPLAWMARSYALELAALGTAMVCWQSALSNKGRPWTVVGLWVSLAIAINSHLFAVFIFVPFAGAQAWRDWSRGRADVPVWLALVSFPASLLPVLHGDRAAAKLYGSTFWAQPKLSELFSSYRGFFWAQWLFIALLLLALGLTAALRAQETEQTVLPAQTSGLLVTEWWFLVLFAVVPLVALPASFVLHVYRDLYTLYFCIGLSLLLIALAAELMQRSRRGGALLLLLLGLAGLPRFLSASPSGLAALVHRDRVHQQLAAGVNAQPYIRLLQQSDLPVLAGDEGIYSEIAAYANPRLKQRAYYLTDAGEFRRYPKSITTQLNFLIFGDVLSYQTMDIGMFLPANPHFLMVVGNFPDMWLPKYVLEAEAKGEAKLSLLGPNYETPMVYDVEFTNMPSFAPAPVVHYPAELSR